MNNGEHKSDWFLKMNPSHKVPVLKDGKQKGQIDFGDGSCPHLQSWSQMSHHNPENAKRALRLQHPCGQIRTGSAFIFSNSHIKGTSPWPNHMQSCNICVHVIPASNHVSYILRISLLEVKLMKHFVVYVISNSLILLASCLAKGKHPKKKSKNSKILLKNFWNFIRISTRLAILLVITWLWPILPSTVVLG